MRMIRLLFLVLIGLCIGGLLGLRTGDYKGEAHIGPTGAIACVVDGRSGSSYEECR